MERARVGTGHDARLNVFVVEEQERKQTQTRDANACDGKARAGRQTDLPAAECEHIVQA